MSPYDLILRHLTIYGRDRSYVEIYDLYNPNQKRTNKQKSEYVRNIFRRLKRLREKIDKGEFLEDSYISKIKRWQLPSGEIRTSIHYDLKDTEKEQIIQKFREEFINDIKEVVKSKDNVIIKRDKKNFDDPVAYEISLPDFHFGKFTGETLEEQRDKFINAVHKLANRAEGLNVERIILPIGNDIFNSEGLSKSTTKGTPQDECDEWMKIFRVGWKTVIQVIDDLLYLAPVYVIIVSGNHDYQLTFNLGEVLTAYYHNNPNVNIDNSFSPRKYHVYGNNIIGFTHGDKEKYHELPTIMAVEKPKEFAKCEHREWHLGHIHKAMTLNDIQGIVIRFLPSLCELDTWHKLNGFRSKKSAQAYIYSKERGCEGFYQINL